MHRRIRAARIAPLSERVADCDIHYDQGTTNDYSDIKTIVRSEGDKVPIPNR